MESHLSSHISALRSLIQDRIFPLDESFSYNEDLFAEGLDSMALMQLMLLLEQEFEINLEVEDYERSNFQTLEKIAKLIERKHDN